MSADDLHQVLDDLEAAVRHLGECGVGVLPVAEATPSPITPAAALPSAASPAPSPEPAPTGQADVLLLTLKRMPACNDADAGLRIGLLLEKPELEGDAYTLLGNMLKAIGFEEDGDPVTLSRPEEAAAQTKLVIAMGQAALDHVCDLGMGVELLRGKQFPTAAGPCFPTFAPSYLDSTPTAKKAAWEDLQKVLAHLELQVPDWAKKKPSA